MSSSKISIALIGYGFSAKTFHLPFLQSSEEFELVGISSSKVDLIKQTMPNIEVYPSAETLIKNTNAQLIIITSPNDSHFSLAKLAIENNKHVVLEKPFVTKHEDGQVLIDLAKQQNTALSVYHNRRWDGDFLTIKKMISENKLGNIRLFESHFDRFRPTVRPRWREMPGEGSGILLDLGPHLIDQALQLFGWPNSVTAQCKAMRDNSNSVDFFHLILHYEQTLVILQSSPYCASPNPRFHVQGDLGSYRVYGVDPQEERLKAGQLPTTPAWSQEEECNFGYFYHNDTNELITTERGAYEIYYRELAQAIQNNKPLPVDAKDALQSIKIIELALESSHSGRTIRAS